MFVTGEVNVYVTELHAGGVSTKRQGTNAWPSAWRHDRQLGHHRLPLPLSSISSSPSSATTTITTTTTTTTPTMTLGGTGEIEGTHVPGMALLPSLPLHVVVGRRTEGLERSGGGSGGGGGSPGSDARQTESQQHLQEAEDGRGEAPAGHAEVEEEGEVEAVVGQQVAGLGQGLHQGPVHGRPQQAAHHQ